MDSINEKESLVSWNEMLELLNSFTEGIYSLLQLIIKKIYRDFGVDRIGFFIPHENEYHLALKLDLSETLPRVGEKYPLENEMVVDERNEDPLVITPRSGVGFDIFMIIRSRKKVLGILALDDTSERREFSKKERLTFRALVGVINSLISNHDYFTDLVYIDPLTTVYNRRYFEEKFESLLCPGSTLAMIDVDFFKRVNDTHGHPMGDAVLSELGRFLKSSIRAGDVVFRYGGEEFLVIFKDCSDLDAFQRLNKILFGFRDKEIRRDGEMISGVTFSAGLWCHEEGPWENTLDEADKKLYLAKENGRARVEM